MNTLPLSKTIAIGLTGLLLAASVATAAEIKVMSSDRLLGGVPQSHPGVRAHYRAQIDTIRGPSMGDRPDPNRIARGEPVDVVIINTEALDRLVADGKVVAASRVELARAPIGAVVRAGAPKPEISTVEALKRTLLEAKSIACSDSGSGVYMSTVLFPRLGISEQNAVG